MNDVVAVRRIVGELAARNGFSLGISPLASSIFHLIPIALRIETLRAATPPRPASIMAAVCEAAATERQLSLQSVGESTESHAQRHCRRTVLTHF
jgi:hypothetical protein